MTAGEIAARLNAKRSGRGKWIARCAAHDDRHASLSIAEGRDGRTLLRCFAGCTVERIVSALGIAMSDLFEGTSSSLIARRVSSKPDAYDLCLALMNEERSLREWQGIKGQLRTSEVNIVRAAIAKRYGVELAPIAPPLYEGGFGGRDRDEVWPALFEWALFVASVRLIGAPIALGESPRPPRGVLIEAEDLAADAMRSLEREAAA